MSKLTYKQMMKMAEGVTDEMIEEVIKEMGLKPANTHKRRHRSILWSQEGRKKRDDSWEPFFHKEKIHKLEPHPRAIVGYCEQCGEKQSRKKNDYFAKYGTCDMSCYADLLGVHLYER